MKKTNKERAGGLFSLQDMDSSWLSRTRPADEEHFEEIAEEIAEEISEEIAEEIEEDIDEVQDYSQEPEVSIMEEVQERRAVSNSRENYSYTSISEVRNKMRKRQFVVFSGINLQKRDIKLITMFSLVYNQLKLRIFCHVAPQSFYSRTDSLSFT